MNNTIGTEKAIMNNLLHYPELLGKLRVTPEMFTEPDVILFMEYISEKGSVDVNDVANHFANSERLGMERITQIYNNKGTGKAFFMNDQIEVLEAYKSRKTKELTASFAKNPDPKEIEYLTQQLQEISNLTIKKENPTTSFIDEFVTGILDGTPREFMKTGISSIDDTILGFETGQLNILAGRPSTGKTALSLTFLWNLAQQGYPCTYFSLETGGVNITERLTSMLCNIPLADIKQRVGLDDDQTGRVIQAADDIIKSGIRIMDAAQTKPRDIRAIAMEKSDKPHIIFIDYIQLMSADKEHKDRRLEVEDISRTLKIIAKECNCMIFALSQLSRGVESRQDKRPMMSDLREGGGIEQDANMIFMLYREDYYNKEMEDESGKSEVEFIVAKNKDGETGTVPIEFYKKAQKFY